MILRPRIHHPAGDRTLRALEAAAARLAEEPTTKKPRARRARKIQEIG